MSAATKADKWGAKLVEMTAVLTAAKMAEMKAAKMAVMKAEMMAEK